MRVIMDKKTYYNVLKVRFRLRLTARIFAFLVLLAGMVFIFNRPSVGLYVWVMALITVIIAWKIPWLGGILAMPVAVLGINLLPQSNWDYWGKLPFYVCLGAFIAGGVLFFTISVLGWILRLEWPLKGRT